MNDLQTGPVLAILLCCGGLLSGDEITLRDGSILHGEVVSPPGSEMVDVRVRAGGMEATRHIPRDQIASVKVGADPAQERAAALQARRDRLGKGGTAEEWWNLAQEAKRDGDSLQWRSCINEVLERDRHHTEARRIVGHSLHRGVWMRADEIATAAGQVPFRGQWVSWRERERTLAEEARSRAEAMAQIAERRRAIAAADAAIAGYGTPSTLNSVYRVVFWPGMGGYYPGGYSGGYHNGCGPSGGIGISGGGSNSRWRFTWRF